MASDRASVAEALHHVLDPLEVDEDGQESLVDMLVDELAEHQDLGTQDLAKHLEEFLGPFLEGFGASEGSIPTSAMSVAVSLKGLPELAAKEAKSTSKAPPPNTAPCEVSDGVINSQPASKTPAFTLADFCAAGSETRPVAKDPKVSKVGSAITGQKSADMAKPQTLGALSRFGETAKAQHLGPVPLKDSVESGSDEECPETVAAGASTNPDNRKGKERQERRAQRLARAEAAANPANASLTAEQLETIAAYGFNDNETAPEKGQRKKVARGVHEEGSGSRNVHLEDISIVLTGDQGSKDVLKETDLHLNAGHVYGLVGKNGCGKTTLMRKLAMGALPGLPAHLRFGYVAQELAALQEGQNAIEAVVDADEERRNLLKERDEIEAMLTGTDEDESRVKRFTEIEQRLEMIEADSAEDRARQALSLFNFDDAMMQRSVSVLSGGWKMRLALARALFGRPDVLLLDEPTNHLDLHTVLWLQDHLRCEWGAECKKKDRIVVIVSHDRSFLDACATDIIEIHEKKLRTFPGNFSSYLERVADEQRILLLRMDEADKQEKEDRKNMKVLKKTAREHKDEKKVRQLKNKENKMFGGVKLSSNRDFGTEKDDIMSKLREDGTLRFRFPEMDTLLDAESNILEVDNACVKQKDTTILRKVTITLEPRSRIAIVGANGSGKSTLMQALAGELKLDEGNRGRGRTHPAYKPGFVSQNHFEHQAKFFNENCMGYLRQFLPDKQNLSGKVEGMTKQSDDSVLRAYLGNFGLGRDALRKVCYLSGGQRVRLSLAIATWWNPSALLLDEPTNHLDLDSLDALTVGLQNFDGPIIVVSHNQGFLEALCDELWIVQNGTVKVCPKGEDAFSDYFRKYVKQIRASIK